jgi:signal transduction histidine kinase
MAGLINNDSIRARIARSILIVVLFALLIGGVMQTLVSYRYAISQTKGLQRAEAVVVAGRIEAFLDSVAMPLKQIARLPWGVGELDEASRRTEYRRLFKAVPAIGEIVWELEDGTVLGFLSRTSPDAFAPVKPPPLHRFPVPPATLEAGFGKPFLVDGLDYRVVIAVRDNKRGGAVAYVTLDLRYLSDMVESMRIGETGYAYVVDSEGGIIAHPHVSTALRQRVLDRVPEQGTIDTRWSLSETGMVKLRQSMVSGVRIGNTGWRVIVQQDAAEVLKPVFEVLWQTALLIAAAVLLAGFLVYRMSSSLVAPIVALDAEARRLAAGDLDVRAKVVGNDEVAKLGHSFNHMASQLQSYTTSLEEKVSEKTAQLELANRHKSEFLANMSHELRTPLNAVIGFSDALKAEYFGRLNDKQKEYVKDINESGQHLLSLISDILDLSKIEAGKMDLEASRFSLPGAIDNALTLVRERARRHHVDLRADIGPEIGEIVADERKVKQVLINLFTNAVKFSHPNGWVQVGARRGKNGVVIAVADSGVGIAPQDHAAIFEAFHQLQTGGSAKQEGTGLGLALSRRFVELHGGTLTVESELGKGATFTFDLPDREEPVGFPAAQLPDSAQAEAPSPQPSPASGRGSE